MKLKYDEALSNSAFDVNLRRYATGEALGAAILCTKSTDWDYISR